MSYRYGLNGNDIRWDMMPHSWTCADCNGGDECDGHTHKYTFGRGFGRILHDTNGNFVRAVGNVPLDIYTTEYLAERVAADYDGDAYRRRALIELADISRESDGVGGWCNNNFGGDTCLYLDDMCAVVRLQGGRVFVADVDTEYEDMETGEALEDSRMFIETPHGCRLYFDECIKFNHGGGQR